MVRSYLLCLAAFFIAGCGSIVASPVATPEPPLLMGDSSGVPHLTASNTVPDLIAVLSNPHSDYQGRVAAAKALERKGGEAAPAVPALINNLQHEDNYVREAVERALGAIGPAAKSAVPMLTNILNGNASTHERSVVAEALGKIGDRSAIPALAKILYDTDRSLAIDAAKALGLLAEQAFPDLHGPCCSSENGVPRIVTAARNWWEQEGQHIDWDKNLSE